MNPDKIPESPAARRFRLFFEERGRQQGLAAARKKNVAEAQRTGLQDSLFLVLLARSLRPSREDDARIRACKNKRTLLQWIRRAVTATSMREVLWAKPPAPLPRRRPPSRPPAAASSR